MPQLFHRRSNAIAKFLVILVPLSLAAFYFILEEFIRSPYDTEVDVALAQPVPFSHKHHVGELKIDCRFCHAFVENSHVAGMPSSNTCMICHSQIWNDAPMLEPVRDSFKNQVPLVWNQVNRIPKFVYFDHSIHVQKGIGCSSCHGHIDRMPLTKQARTFYMRDCLSCHRNPENELRPLEAVFNPEYKYPENQLVLGKELLQKYHIQKELIMECYTCHR
jgi:cytochrome c7-like protein